MSCGHHHETQANTPSYPVQNLSPGAKWIKGLTKGRLGQFNGGHYSDVNLGSALYIHRLDSEEFVKLQVWSAPGRSKPFFDEAIKQEYKKAKKGDSFGPSWTNHWWKVTVKIPAYFTQYKTVQFEFDPGCEAMIYSTEGVPLQGITGGFGIDRRVEHIIPRKAIDAGQYDFVIESSCNGMFGVPWSGDTIDPPDMNRYFSLASADLVVIDTDAWGLWWDFTTLRELVDTLPGNTVLQNKALVTANEIMNVFGRGKNHEDILKARKVAEGIFGEAWESKGEKIYKEGPQRPQIWGIGYCHIDTAWLWPYSVTQQKVARSWSTQVDLMDRYPEHRFTCTQAQQFKWLEQQYPPLFERIKEKVLSGQFQLIGGSWVENDGNMPSGEALIRQFLLGQRYFESRFGKRCETAWLPDSFGLTGSLPQLIRDSGMKYFFTQKLSWNNINVFPHTTFNWVGIDGTQVLCHMTPVDTYTAQASAGDVNKGQTNHKNLESSDTALLVFGNGDGGGGPLAKMLENLRRIRAASNENKDIPSVLMGTSVEDFFEDLEKTTNVGSKLPSWHGELYLEFHRGTYTSHGSIKKGNRKSEILLRDVEHVATLASLHSSDYIYPQTKINDCWEKVLLNQFHDVLPGSAIGMVYEDAEKLYAEVAKDGKELLDEAHRVILGSAPFNAESRLVGYNTTSFARRDVVAVPLNKKSSPSLRSQMAQISKDGDTGYALMTCKEGSTLAMPDGLWADCKTVSVFTNGADHFVLRNAAIQLTISGGRITSLYDVELDRELIQKGATGGLIIFEDRPNYWDAWDVEIHHLETWKPLEFSNIHIVAEGPLRATVASKIKYGQSTIDVLISLDAITASMKNKSRPLINFQAHVDWHQRHEFLKFEIPLDIHSDTATYESQFGHVSRPTHKNTTWDMAKFEVCGHKYADLSEFGYGVSILSESKYGFSCIGNILRISLLRGATAPDADQDQGEHDFSWAILPHEGHFIQSDIAEAAYIYNSPLHVKHVAPQALETIHPRGALFTVQGAHNVFLETIKRGEDDSFGKAEAPKTIILRLYEAYGGHAKAKIHINHRLKIKKAYLTNLLEDDGQELSVAQKDDGVKEVSLSFHGFQVRSLKLVVDDKHDSDAEIASTEKGSKKRDSESWITL